MQTTPLNGFPVYQNSDPLDYGSQMADVLRDVDSKAPPVFGSVGERNVAYSTWVAAGNAMRDGLMCSVAGKPMVYRGGSWRGIVREAPVYGPATRQLPLKRSDDVEDSFFAGGVPDPGYPYRLWVSAEAYTFASGGQCHVRVRAGNGAPDNQLPVVTNAINAGNNTTGVDLMTPWRATGTLTGASRVIGYAVMIGSSGSWEITNASVYYQIEPA